MGSNDIIVREYLESLKEDKELDYLFPILLNLIGFKIVSTAKESKGQPQYGKDIIAIGKGDDGLKKKFYFELKGHADRDIDQTVFLKTDGIRESILEAKITSFNDSSIPGFNDLPIQIVVVHNGVLRNNTRKTFEDFISKEFPLGGFERWDIYKLTDLFSTHLFGEYLFTDDETIRLFKRTLVLLDAPDYDFSDFKDLVNLQVSKTLVVESRAFKKFFATMNLLTAMIIHYSKESNNLFPARQCVTYLLLSLWSWILRSNLQGKKGVIREFRKILKLHYLLLDEYFRKTRVAVEQEDGLFSLTGQMFEAVGYPLRCFDYLDYLIYYFRARHHFPSFDHSLSDVKTRNLIKRQFNYLVTMLNNNEASTRPLLDNHSISILNVVIFLLQHGTNVANSRETAREYVSDILKNIFVIKVTRNRFPELYNNIEMLTEFVAKNERPHLYEDRSSLLITYLFDILAVLNAKDEYVYFRSAFDGEVNLQLAYSDLELGDLEPLLFTRHLHEEMYVQANISLPEDFEEFRASVLTRRLNLRKYETDKAGFGFLRYLAHTYFKNEFFVEEWLPFSETKDDSAASSTAS